MLSLILSNIIMDVSGTLDEKSHKESTLKTLWWLENLFAAVCRAHNNLNWIPILEVPYTIEHLNSFIDDEIHVFRRSSCWSWHRGHWWRRQPDPNWPPAGFHSPVCAGPASDPGHGRGHQLPGLQQGGQGAEAGAGAAAPDHHHHCGPQAQQHTGVWQVTIRSYWIFRV